MCTDCGEPLEAVQSFTEPSLTVCPACGGTLRKVFSAVGVVFKGSGFYRTDSRSGAGKGDAAKGDGVPTGDSAGKAESGGKGDAGGKGESGATAAKKDSGTGSSGSAAGNGAKGSGSSDSSGSSGSSSTGAAATP
jgi:putative FmdB family regulatory protein